MALTYARPVRPFVGALLLGLALLGSCRRHLADGHGPSAVADAIQSPPQGVLRVRNTIAIGDRQACALTAGGGVACWTAARVATKKPGRAPVPVPDVHDAVGVVAARGITCAWSSHGAVWCWGGDDALGEDEALPPGRIRGLVDAVEVVAFDHGACALRHDGHVSCWDDEAWHSPLWPPVEDLPFFSDAVEIAWADDALCARTRANDVACTVRPGAKKEPGSIRDRVLKTLPALHGATSLAGAGDTFAALLPGERLAVWQMADVEGRVVPAAEQPVRITRGMPGARVVLGGWAPNVVGLCVTGDTTRCWPAWTFGAHASEPAVAPRVLGPAVEDIALGDEVSCLRREGRLLCWGDTARLGGEAPAGFSFLALTDVLQIEAGVDSMCALRQNGRVVCWGARPGATNPDGTPFIDSSPSELPVVDDAVELAMSADDICVRRKNGQVACWTTSAIGAQSVRESDTLVGVTRLLSSNDAICGVQASGEVVCTAATTGAPRVDTETRASLGKNLTTGIPCAKNSRGKTTCWRGAGASTAAYDESNAQLCVVRAGRVTCQHADGTALDPLAGRTDVSSYDGRYAITTDARVVTSDASAKGRAPVDALLDVVELRADLHVLCARTRDGRVSCWGEPDYVGTGAPSAAAGPVTLSIALGASRAFTPEGVAEAAAPSQATTPVRRLRGVRMAGPFVDTAHACASVRCKRDEVQSCGEPTQAMTSPPPPLRAVGLLPVDCRAESDEHDHDETATYRLLVTRADGAWISGPLASAGGDDRSCAGAIATRYATHGAIVTLDLTTDTRCRSADGSTVNGEELLVGLANGARPESFAPLALGVAKDGTVLELAADFAADGTLVVSGPARWPATEGSPTPGTTPVGTYRFVTR